MPRLNATRTTSAGLDGLEIRAMRHGASADVNESIAAALRRDAAEYPSIVDEVHRRAGMLESRARAHRSAEIRLGEENIRQGG